MNAPVIKSSFNNAYPKIIFLDFDGPLSNERTYLDRDDRHQFDRLAVRALNHVCQASGAKIVCTSSRTWPSVASFKETCALMADAGLDLKHLHPDWCCVFDLGSRAPHIRGWLERHPEVTHYAIVDDERVDLPHLVLVNESDGILMNDIKLLAKLLEVSLSDVFRAGRAANDNGQLMLPFGSFEGQYNQAVMRQTP